MKSTKLVVVYGDLQVNKAEDVLELYKISSPDLKEKEIIKVFGKVDNHDVCTTAVIFAENQEELLKWKSYIMEYDQKKELFEWDFYSFMNSICLEEEFLEKTLDDRIGKVKLYSFDFEV